MQHFYIDPAKRDPVFRGDSPGLVLHGLAVPFGKVGAPHPRTRSASAPFEKFKRGCFRSALEGDAYRDVELRFLHPSSKGSKAIASTRNDTLVLAESDAGLIFEARLPEGSGFIRKILERESWGCSVAVFAPRGETFTFRGEVGNEIHSVRRIDHIALVPQMDACYPATWVGIRHKRGQTGADVLDELFGSSW